MWLYCPHGTHSIVEVTKVQERMIYMWQSISFHYLEGLLSLEGKAFSEEMFCEKDSIQIAYGRTWQVEVKGSIL